MSNIIPCIIMIKTVNIILNSWLINIEMTNRTKFHLILTSHHVCLLLCNINIAIAINVTMAMALNFAEECCCIKLPIIRWSHCDNLGKTIISIRTVAVYNTIGKNIHKMQKFKFIRQIIYNFE